MHLLEVGQHPGRRRVPGPEHGPHELADPRVGVEVELLDAERDGLGEERGAGRRVGGEDGGEPAAMPAAGGAAPHSSVPLAAAASATASSPSLKKPARGVVASQFGWPAPGVEHRAARAAGRGDDGGLQLERRRDVVRRHVGVHAATPSDGVRGRGAARPCPTSSVIQSHEPGVGHVGAGHGDADLGQRRRVREHRGTSGGARA